jgi:predicted ATPase
LAETLLDEGQKRQDKAATLVGHRMNGFTAYLMGDFVPAKAHFEEHLALYNSAQHRSLAFQFAQDPRVSCLANYALLKWITGDPDASLAMSRQAVAYAREFDHANTRAYAECFALQVLQFRRDVSEIEARAVPLIASLEERRFSMWAAWASTICAWAVAQRGDVEGAIAQMDDKLSGLRASGQGLWLPYFLTLQAESLALAGQKEAALGSGTYSQYRRTLVGS